MRTLGEISVVCAIVAAGIVAGVVDGVLPGHQTTVFAQQPEIAKGAAILAEARKALGGEDKLAAIKRIQVNGTSRRANGNFNLDGETEVFIELPDKFRRNESLTLGAGGPGIERTEGLNGTEFWNETSGGDFGGRGRGRFGGGFGGAAQAGAPQGGAAPADGRGAAPSPETLERLRDFQRRNLQSEVSRLLLAMLLSSDAPVAWIGTAQAPEGSADVLEVKTPDGVATRIFIDAATHMPLMLTWTGQGGRGFGAGRGGQGRRGQGAPADGGAAPAGTPAPAGAEPAAPAAGAQPGAAAPADGAGQGRRGRGAQGGGQPVTLEMHLSEYKTVNGVKFPHLITRGVSGETNEEWIIKGYKINPNLKANTFTR